MTASMMSRLLGMALEPLRKGVVGSILLVAALAIHPLAGAAPVSRHGAGALPGGAERGFDPDHDCGVVPASAGLHLVNRVTPLPQAASTSLCSRDCGEPVEYRSWLGNTHQMRRFVGKYVQLLVPEEWLDLPDFGADVRRSLVDSVDLGYQYFKDLTRREPAGPGLLPVAIVDPPGCGYGCGFVGGRELRSATMRTTSPMETGASAGQRGLEWYRTRYSMRWPTTSMSGVATLPTRETFTGGPTSRKSTCTSGRGGALPTTPSSWMGSPPMRCSKPGSRPPTGRTLAFLLRTGNDVSRRRVARSRYQRKTDQSRTWSSRGTGLWAPCH